jgi:S-adenosylmethionine hydrolase
MNGKDLKPALVLQTDFSLLSGQVASMYGVIKQVDPRLDIYDLNHNIPLFDTLTASATLRMTMPFWPKGTIFVSVVDPGVGTERRSCIAKTANGYYVVTPDNGTLTYMKLYFGIDEVRVIDERFHRYPGTEKHHTFHGRDVYAYCAAKLAAGVITYEQVGPAYPLDEIIVHPVGRAEVTANRAEGEVSSLLPNSGNINTNIDTDEFEKTGIRHGDMVCCVITVNGRVRFDERILYHKSFGYANVGDPVLFNGSSGFMGLALNQDNLLKKYFTPEDIAVPRMEWKILIEKTV